MTISFQNKLRMFWHSRRCGECNVRFWAGLALEYSSKALRPSFLAHAYLAVAKFCTRRRLAAQWAVGMTPYEHMTPEQQASVRAEYTRVTGQKPPADMRLH